MFLVAISFGFPAASLLDGLQRVKFWFFIECLNLWIISYGSEGLWYELFIKDQQYGTAKLDDYFENLIQKGYEDFGNFVDKYLNGYQ